MEGNPIITQLKEFENNKHIEIQKDILDDLQLLRKTLLEEIESSQTGGNNAELEKKVNKLEYRLKHLSASYLNLKKQNHVDITKLKAENSLLKEKLAATGIKVD